MVAQCGRGCLQLSAEILQRNGNTLETSKAWWPQVNLCQALHHRPLEVGVPDRFLSCPECRSQPGLRIVPGGRLTSSAAGLPALSLGENSLHFLLLSLGFPQGLGASSQLRCLFSFSPSLQPPSFPGASRVQADASAGSREEKEEEGALSDARFRAGLWVRTAAWTPGV